jgi:hypothetical protein
MINPLILWSELAAVVLQGVWTTQNKLYEQNVDFSNVKSYGT